MFVDRDRMVGAFALLAGLTSCGEPRLPSLDQADLADDESLPGDGDGDGGDTDESTSGDGDGDGSTSGHTDESTSEDESTDSTTEDESTSGDAEPCSCVELDQICDLGTAMNDCELPSPCGVLNGDAEAAMCILQLLVDGAPARFEYYITNPDCYWENESWSGWFYILGPGVGIDNECHAECADLLAGEIPTAHHYTIAEPAYFADCFGKTASVMTGCVVNGLSIGDEVVECGP